MDPCTHGQFGDENVTAFGEQYGCLCRDHFDVRVSLHHLLYPGQGELMELVVVGFILEVIDGLLPISRQNVAIAAIESLTDLKHVSLCLCRSQVGGYPH